jgi:ABC-type lipoprotein export system ATPase subunit
VIITHDEKVSKCAERIIEIMDGKIVSDSPNLNRRIIKEI